MTAHPWDIKLIIDPAGTPTEIGLMLVKPENQPKQYLITEVPSPDPHVDWVQRDFRGGMTGMKIRPSLTDEYWIAGNMSADPQTGALVSAPDFKEASTVGSNNLTVFGGTVHNLADGTNIVLLINNNDLYMSNTAGTAFTSSYDPSATPISVASWGDYILLGILGGDYRYSTNDGSNFTTSTLDPGKTMDYFIPAGDVVWGIDTPDSLRWSSDPSNTGEWSGETLVGDDVNDRFVGGFFLAQILVIVKMSGIYTVDDGGNVEKIVELKNIRGACTDRVSKIYFIDIQDNVWEYDIFQGLLRNLELHSAVYLNPDIGGNIGGGIAWAEGKVYVSPSKVIYQWSQFRDNRGRLTSEAWECLYGDSALQTTYGILCAANELLDGTRVDFPVYFGGSATATKMGYVRARSVGDLGDTSNLTYCTTDSYVYSSWIDHGHPTIRKLYQYAEVDLDGNDLNARLSFAVDDDIKGGAGNFTNLGAAAITSLGKTLVEFPSGTEGYKICIRLLNDPTDSADYVMIKSWGVHATLQPSYRRQVQIAARIADGLTDRMGGRHQQRGDTIRTNLEAARTSHARIQLQDYFGNDFDIVLLAPFVEIPSRDEHASDTESEIQFSAVEYGVRVAT